MRTSRVLPSRGTGDRVEALRRAMVGMILFGDPPEKRPRKANSVDSSGSDSDDSSGSDSDDSNGNSGAPATYNQLMDIIRASDDDPTELNNVLSNGSEAMTQRRQTDLLDSALERHKFRLADALLDRGIGNLGDQQELNDRLENACYVVSSDRHIDFELTEFLLDRGADPYETDILGIVASYGDAVGVEFLIEHGVVVQNDNLADIEIDGPESVYVLCEAGANPNGPFAHAKTALDGLNDYIERNGWDDVDLEYIINPFIDCGFIYSPEMEFHEVLHMEIQRIIRNIPGPNGVEIRHRQWLDTLPMESIDKQRWINKLPESHPLRAKYLNWLETLPESDPQHVEYNRWVDSLTPEQQARINRAKMQRANPSIPHNQPTLHYLRKREMGKRLE